MFFCFDEISVASAVALVCMSNRGRTITCYQKKIECVDVGVFKVRIIRVVGEIR